MEASRFGFGDDVAPAFKFDPTEADLVAFYLLPRALGRPNPHAHAIIDDDPASAPPWELLRRHNHGDSAHAFFFGPPADRAKNGRRKSRVVAGGGTWQGQKPVEATLTLLRAGGGEADIRYRKYSLSYHHSKEDPSSGWIMHEYEILSPPLPATVLSHIRFDTGKRNKVRRLAGEEQPADAVVAVGQEQGFQDAEQQGGGDYSQQVLPSSNQLDLIRQYHAVTGDEEGFSGAQQNGDDIYYGDNGGAMGEMGGCYSVPCYAREDGSSHNSRRRVDFVPDNRCGQESGSHRG